MKEQVRGKGGNTNNGSSNNTCNFCSIEEHNEAQCNKKNHEKAPEWWRKKNAKAKSAMASMKICLTSIGNIEGKGGYESGSDTFTKNVTLTILNHHVPLFVELMEVLE